MKPEPITVPKGQDDFDVIAYRVPVQSENKDYYPRLTLPCPHDLCDGTGWIWGELIRQRCLCYKKNKELQIKITQ